MFPHFKKYILVDRKPVLCDDVEVWAVWYDNFQNRRVALDKIGEYEISTVFLSLDTRDHRLFETLVRDAAYDEVMSRRYLTWEESEKGHRAIVGEFILMENRKIKLNKTFNLIKRLEDAGYRINRR